MTYKAKIKNKEEWVTGFIAKESSMNEWIIFTGDLHWEDGSEWRINAFEIIDISTAHLATDETIVTQSADGRVSYSGRQRIIRRR